MRWTDINDLAIELSEAHPGVDPLTVSYTHLDVYKRQDYMLKSTVKRENPDYNYQSYDMVNSKNHSYYMAVSYTHLDVYKRQELISEFLTNKDKKLFRLQK